MAWRLWGSSSIAGRPPAMSSPDQPRLGSAAGHGRCLVLTNQQVIHAFFSFFFWFRITAPPQFPRQWNFWTRFYISLLILFTVIAAWIVSTDPGFGRTRLLVVARVILGRTTTTEKGRSEYVCPYVHRLHNQYAESVFIFTIGLQLMKPLCLYIIWFPKLPLIKKHTIPRTIMTPKLPNKIFSFLFSLRVI
jgi:hypothetical protein